MQIGKDILMIFSYYGIGGAQRRAVSLANEMSKRGYKVTILALLGEDGTIKNQDYYKIDKQVELILIPQYYEKHKLDSRIENDERIIKRRITLLKKLQYIFRTVKSIKGRIDFYIRSLRNCIQLRSYLITHQEATIIHFGFNILERTYFATKGLKFKIIYAETNASKKYELEKNYKYTRNLIKKMDGCVFQTEEEMREHGLEKSIKNVIIYNPINFILPEPCTSERRKVIVNFCRLSRQKNILLLIRAFEQFYFNHLEYQLHIYADTQKDLEYRDEIMKYIMEHNLEKCVFLFSPCVDVHYKVYDAEMFVSSSDYEGLSNSMLEAMAIGLPCICTDCAGGGAREVIHNYENGILVPVNDVDALREAMERMANDTRLAKLCSVNALKIKEELKVERIVEKWIAHIDNVCS